MRSPKPLAARSIFPRIRKRKREPLSVQPSHAVPEIDDGATSPSMSGPVSTGIPAYRRCLRRKTYLRSEGVKWAQIDLQCGRQTATARSLAGAKLRFSAATGATMFSNLRVGLWRIRRRPRSACRYWYSNCGANAENRGQWRFQALKATSPPPACGCSPMRQ